MDSRKYEQFEVSKLTFSLAFSYFDFDMGFGIPCYPEAFPGVGGCIADLAKEGFEVVTRACHGATYRRKIGAVEQKNLQCGMFT